MSNFCFGLTSGDVTVSLGSGPYFYADDGNCGSSEVPQAAYVVINVLNNSSSDTLYNIQVKLSSMSNNSLGFKLLSFTTDSTYTIPRILPDSSIGAYFYMQYPCTKSLTTNLGFTLTDDNSGSVSFSTSMSTFDIGRAAAGGDIIDQNIAGIDALGILIADTVTYDFGNYNGGHLVFQPSGDTLFPVDDMELIGSEILSSPFGSCGPKAGDRNILYYNAGSGCGAGSGNQVVVVYYYLSTLFNNSAVFKPYAAMKSGGPTKYLSNYASGIAKDTFSTTTAANKFTMSKTASCGICTPGDTITYTITISNSSSESLMFDKLLDSMPTGHTFIGFATGSDIDESNSSVYPSTGETGNILFTGLIPTPIFPYRSFVVPGGSSIDLIYEVEIPGTSSSTLYTNTAIGQVGLVRVDTASVTTCAGCSALPVELIKFSADIENTVAKVQWSTASEINHVGYDLYKSTNGRDYTWLNHTPGRGNSFNQASYVYVDEEVNEGITLYKLVQSDADGNTTDFYTSVKSLGTTLNKTLVVYPNPTNSVLNVIYSEQESEATAVIYNSLGKLVMQAEIVNASQAINIEELPSGMYYLELKDGVQTSRRVGFVKY